MVFKAREQRLTIIVVLLVGAWAVLTWLADPLIARGDELKQQVEAQTIKLEKLSALMASRSVVEDEYIQVEPYLQAAMAQHGEPAAFFSELEELAREADVQINLKPRISRGRDKDGLVVELELLAPQVRLFALLDALLTMPQLVEIERLHLAPAPSDSGQLRAHLILSKRTFAP